MFVFIPQLFLYIWRAAHHITQEYRVLVFFRFRTQQYHLYFLYIRAILFCFSFSKCYFTFSASSLLSCYHTLTFVLASWFYFYMSLRPTLSVPNKISQAIRIISEFKIIRVICDWIEAIISIMISYIRVKLSSLVVHWRQLLRVCHSRPEDTRFPESFLLLLPCNTFFFVGKPVDIVTALLTKFPDSVNASNYWFPRFLLYKSHQISPIQRYSEVVVDVPTWIGVKKVSKENQQQETPQDRWLVFLSHPKNEKREQQRVFVYLRFRFVWKS